jgi:hypothetical protein
MRTLGEDFRQYRVPGEDGDEVQGAFIFPGILSGPPLRVIASASRRWDHVSVSPRKKRCPTWEEMCWVKNKFFEPDEVVMQLHPAEKDWISIHPYVLHLWRPVNLEIPLPPKIMV